MLTHAFAHLRDDNIKNPPNCNTMCMYKCESKMSIKILGHICECVSDSLSVSVVVGLAPSRTLKINWCLKVIKSNFKIACSKKTTDNTTTTATTSSKKWRASCKCQTRCCTNHTNNWPSLRDWDWNDMHHVAWWRLHVEHKHGWRVVTVNAEQYISM